MLLQQTANEYMRQTFGCKVYKLALDGGFTCPNRDGSCGTGGCIFCSGGSGDYSVPVGKNVGQAIEYAKSIVGDKCRSGKYIAYYQSYTGTYAPLPRLKELFGQTIAHPDIVALDIGTRPDCIDEEVVALLAELNRIKPVWIELGLQTVHEATAGLINRGYTLAVYDRAIELLKEAGIYTIVHMIIGLPGETPDMMISTAEYISKSGADGIKLQLLHVLEGTVLADMYRCDEFEVLSLEEYISVLKGCVKVLRPDICIHRLTGDGAKKDLIAPLWSGDKKRVLNAIMAAL